VKWTLGIAGALLIFAIAALLLPTRITLELYDVQDITYSLADFGGGVSISLAGREDPYEDIQFSGEEVANVLRAIVPGLSDDASGRTIQFQNGLIIVRATAPQHAAVRCCLTVTQAAIASLNEVNKRLARAKITICTRLLGMITR
jgi:hypothetical protein